MTKALEKAYWHIHHEVLLEFATEPIENRIAYIKAKKPADEVPIRLRLLHEVKGKLPLRVVRARAACNKAEAAYNKAEVSYNKAWADYDKAMVAFDKAEAAYNKALSSKAIQALHAKECPNCPWDGTTIFPEKKK